MTETMVDMEEDLTEECGSTEYDEPIMPEFRSHMPWYTGTIR